MDNPLIDITVNLDSGIIFVNSVPDCFLTPKHALEHFYADANDGSDVAATMQLSITIVSLGSKGAESARCQGRGRKVPALFLVVESAPRR